jgi:hypothetical protein
VWSFVRARLASWRDKLGTQVAREPVEVNDLTVVQKLPVGSAHRLPDGDCQATVRSDACRERFDARIDLYPLLNPVVAHRLAAGEAPVTRPPTLRTTMALLSGPPWPARSRKQSRAPAHLYQRANRPKRASALT